MPRVTHGPNAVKGGQGVEGRGVQGRGAEGQGAEEAGAINDRAFLALISDQALRRVIITGRRDLGMPDYSDSNWRSPKFKPLTSAEIDDLVALLACWRQGGSADDKGGTQR